MPEELVSKEQKFADEFSIFSVLVFIFVIGINFYVLYFQKNYDFIVETACDPTKEECFERDCSEEGFCPPNNLSNFKRFSINAKDFKMCENEDCSQVCESEAGVCEQIACTPDEEFGEYCVSPEPNEEGMELDPVTLPPGHFKEVE